MGKRFALLPDRGVVAASGPDARRLLHDLVTADVNGLEPGRARLSALLSPQGKIMFDFLILCEEPDSFLLDTAGAKAGELAKRLLFYRLRARMDIADLSHEKAVAAVWDGEPETLPGLAFADPRLPELGARVIGLRTALEVLPGQASPDAWHARRVTLGIPEGGRDFAFGDAFPHEACMDQLGGVDFGKGCYVGQEVVSRMEHRGMARTRIVPVRLDGAAEPGTGIEAGGRPAGRLGSVAGDRALAMLRLDRVADALAEGRAVTAGAAVLTLVKPAWARFPFPGEPGFGARPETGGGL